jgi:hypothetical protein
VVTNSGGGTGTGLSTYLEIVAVLAGLALVAGLAGLYLTRDRKLPAVALAGSDVPPAPLGPPGDRFRPPPKPDADHDWGSQTPGPPPPPPPPGPYEDGEP